MNDPLTSLVHSSVTVEPCTTAVFTGTRTSFDSLPDTTRIYPVSQKKGHSTVAHDLVKYWPVFTIYLRPENSAVIMIKFIRQITAVEYKIYTKEKE